MVASGFRAGAPALVDGLQQGSGGSDDCALVLIWRVLDPVTQRQGWPGAHQSMRIAVPLAGILTLMSGATDANVRSIR
jgi:hypothetical protein